MSVLTKDTWVLVTDSEKALFLRNDVDAENPDLNVLRIEEQDNPPNREQAANRRGRMNDGAPGQRSALDDTDWHELAKERFAEDLADILYTQAHKGAFERIVIVAGPSVLGNLRDALHKEVSDKVVAEIDKNLAGHPIDEIEKALKDALAN
ncbi:host attachment family protein [Litorisediminicola beolgyonensis]|uniref:Host attachment family protein n=1 Tax=Litorisediminicola beolgyonensis TaxID=1173614 RepID=A0ABW3ZIW2_9RHOB